MNWKTLWKAVVSGKGAMPRAELRTLEGQGHDVTPEVLAPVMVELFSAQ